MPKSFFSQDNAVSLDALAPGAKIHLIGVCGVAMAQLAVVLAERGFQVSGSDKEFYEPMGSLLKKSNVALLRGYDRSNLSSECELAVIGNAISYGHPEVDVIEELNLPYSFFPKLLHELVIAGRHSIVVTGTHGKTTTAAWCAHLLREGSCRPSYFIGGREVGHSRSLVVDDGSVSVVEGDEYDSAFFAKVPKFTYYQPDTLIVNAIEFDHSDIYASVDVIGAEFSKLVYKLNPDALLLCSSDCGYVRSLLGEWRQKSAAKITTFGVAEDSDYRIETGSWDGKHQTVHVFSADERFECRIPLAGSHNARNATAALLAARRGGVGFELGQASLATFGGVRRRLEVRAERESSVLIEDFAHHPTAIAETLTTIRVIYPKHQLWALFEPRSNTTRRNYFERELAESLGLADRVLLKEVVARSGEADADLLDTKAVTQTLVEQGKEAWVLMEPGEFVERIAERGAGPHVIVVMSNGAFDGLIDRLVDLMNSE